MREFLLISSAVFAGVVVALAVVVTAFHAIGWL
jgi:hypothetical protein